MVGRTNSGVGGSGLGSLNSKCLVWLPLNGSWDNYGNSDLTFKPSANSNWSWQYIGPVYPACYFSSSHTSGYGKSDKPIMIGKQQSFFCWGRFNTLTSMSSLGGSFGGQHRADNGTGMGLNIKYVSASTGYLTISTGKGNSTDRTYNTYCGSTLLNAYNWYHLGYTYDGNVAKLYVNGKLDGTHTVGDLSIVADNVIIGVWELAASVATDVYDQYELYGGEQDVRIYNTVLTEKEITKLYEQRPITKPRTKPVRYIKCEINGSSANSGSHFVEVQAFNASGQNVAKGKTGNLVTDEVIASNPYLETGSVTIDLGSIQDINYIKIWHYFADSRYYYKNKCSVSTDGTNYEEMFNSDINGQYVETGNGFVVMMVPGK